MCNFCTLLGEEHRELLEEDLAESVGEFCDEISEMINTMSGDHERELKRLFWKKGKTVESPISGLHRGLKEAPAI